MTGWLVIKTILLFVSLFSVWAFCDCVTFQFYHILHMHGQKSIILYLMVFVCMHLHVQRFHLLVLLFICWQLLWYDANSDYWPFRSAICMLKTISFLYTSKQATFHIVLYLIPFLWMQNFGQCNFRDVSLLSPCLSGQYKYITRKSLNFFPAN